MNPNDRLDAEFAEFVSVQTKPLLALAMGMTGDHHEAWDLVQEALVRMGERWNKGNIEQPEAYVRTIMVRLNIDRFRRLKREILTRNTPDRAIDWKDPLGESDFLEALKILPLRQRTTLALRYVDDLTTAEIATRMNCAEGTVRSQLSKGVARLRLSLNGNQMEKE